MIRANKGTLISLQPDRSENDPCLFGSPAPHFSHSGFPPWRFPSISFHKDGYTDLRGKFDYLSHTGIDPATIKRLALLISHPEKGARTVIYQR